MLCGWYTSTQRKCKDKPIIFTKHARERIKKRELSEEWVIDIICNHSIGYPVSKDGTQEFRKKGKTSYYYAVVEHKKSACVVITAGESEYEEE